MPLERIPHPDSRLPQETEMDGKMKTPQINLSSQARYALRSLRAEACESAQQLPRLTGKQVIALTLGEPEPTDSIIREDGVPLLAISRAVLDSLPEGERLEIIGVETGEPVFRLIPPRKPPH